MFVFYKINCPRMVVLYHIRSARCVHLSHWIFTLTYYTFRFTLYNVGYFPCPKYVNVIVDLRILIVITAYIKTLICTVASVFAVPALHCIE